MTQTPWWQSAVIYQIYPKSFQDSGARGTGDLKGIMARLDYLKTLGVDALWLTPVYVSPQVDNGYDIADYLNIDPAYGTMSDFEALLAAAHAPCPNLDWASLALEAPAALTADARARISSAA